MSEMKADELWDFASPDALLHGYQQMAYNKERESEALAWSEALIGDEFGPR